MPSRNRTPVRVVAAYFMEADDSSPLHWLELECADGDVLEVRVHPSDEAYELDGVIGDERATRWALEHAEECAKACEAARNGSYFDPFTRVWRAPKPALAAEAAE